MVLTGHGGLDKLMWRDDIATPQAGPNEVLIRVLAASVNNTDINTRTGWYSAKPSTNVSTASTNASTTQPAQSASAVGTGWSGAALAFPLIQGADCCGEIVQVGAGVSPSRVGERVMVRALQAPPSTDNSGAHTVTFGTDYDGAFAQYSTCASHNAIAVHSTLSAVELASFPCAFSTAEGMIQRANLGAERVLITGASGGVGSAAVQLCKRRGAHVTAITTSDKAQHLKDLGANTTLDRDQALESNITMWCSMWWAARDGRTTLTLCAPADAIPWPALWPAHWLNWTCAFCICAICLFWAVLHSPNIFSQTWSLILKPMRLCPPWRKPSHCTNCVTRKKLF